MPCAPDLIAVSVIVYTGSVIGASCVLRPKGNDTWIVPAILWGLLIGPPGDMKSPAMAAAARPLMALTAEARAQYEKEMLAYGAEKLKYDARMATLEEALKKTARSDSVEGLNRAAEQIADLKAHAPKEPVHRRFETHDTTVEKFLDLLCDNHRGMMHRLDEATRLFFGFERPEHAGDRSTYLEGFNALYPRTIDRIKRGTRHVPHNCITLFGGIQPDAYAKWADVATDIGKNDGFLPRFGLMIYPDATLWGWVNKGPIPGAYERVLEIFRKLAYSDPATFGAIRGDKEEFPAFRFSPAAQEIFIQWLTELRAVRIPRESDPLIRQHLSKSDRVFCSLALVFHLIDRADYEILHGAGIDADGTVQYGFPGGGGEVSEDCVRRAAAWIEYLWSHMRRCYAVIGNHRIRGANLLAEKIMHGELRDGFSKRDIYRPQWAGLRGQEEVKSAIEWLESENWIRRAPRGVGAKGGRPTERYEIHPELLAGHKENTGD
jgi:putative DNA primase/helicase